MLISDFNKIKTWTNNFLEKSLPAHELKYGNIQLETRESFIGAVGSSALEKVQSEEDWEFNSKYLINNMLKTIKQKGATTVTGFTLNLTTNNGYHGIGLQIEVFFE